MQAEAAAAMWGPSISICMWSRRRCRTACAHHWSPDRRAKLRITIPTIHFKGYPRTNGEVSSNRDNVPLPPLRRRVRGCLHRGDLLHSNLAATADLLRRVHAPWPVHRPRNPILPPTHVGGCAAGGTTPRGERGRSVRLQPTNAGGGWETASRFWSLTSGLY